MVSFIQCAILRISYFKFSVTYNIHDMFYSVTNTAYIVTKSRIIRRDAHY